MVLTKVQWFVAIRTVSEHEFCFLRCYNNLLEKYLMNSQFLIKMNLFHSLFAHFERSPANRELLDDYASLQEVAEKLFKELSLLRKLHENILASQVKKRGLRTGGIAFKKVLFIEEALVPELRKLAEKAEQRFQEAGNVIEKYQPLSPAEAAAITGLIQFLQTISQNVPSLTDLEKKTTSERLLEIENALRTVEKQWKEYLKKQQEVKILARKVVEHEINPLVRRIFANAKETTFFGNGRHVTVLAAKVSDSELKLIEKESAKINSCRDPNYRILWRDWWREHHLPQVDPTIPLPPHINVSMKLGGKKKEIHLLAA